ncbi:MAG: phosphoenolpyruvate--protein phosphotransferase [Desulfobacterales bacterium CG23_combo_of_CG06-09_8_20_14_all_52_9]|nr:MAG: phosphoenolpyruvate--protein phosphotransferase [Desulfobacterales bacterium CG23_combo_of_CG06-09_8_20_14_all_52_9]
MQGFKKKEIRLKGISGSPGICIGRAYLVDHEGVDVVERYFIDPKEIKKEMNRFKHAVQNAIEELKGIIKNSPKDYRQHVQILETHILLLKDKMLYEKTLSVIEKEHVNAEWALKKVVSDAQAVFKEMEDPYLRERASDIAHVGQLVMRNLVGAEGVNLANIDKRVILVARELSPAETSQIQLESIKGFVTDFGGEASHTSIIARSLQIPSVLGLENASQVIKNEDALIVDGYTGEVILYPRQETLREYKLKKDRYEARKAQLIRTSKASAKTTDGYSVSVMGNIELPEEVVAVLDHGGEGIGLYRTEFQYLNRSDFPSEEELYEKYKDVVEVMGDRSTTIRTLDINGEKTISFRQFEAEKNPALGLRAIRFCLQYPEVFKTQLRAILRVADIGKVKILFPMISCVDELLAAKEILKQAGDSLKKDGLPFARNIEIGLLIEIPAAVTMADALIQEVDFFSIGTNDLIQYAFAIDRGNARVAHLYRPLHPAVVRMLKQIADSAKMDGKKVAICGEMAGDPLHAPLLLGLGIDEFSMNPQFIPAVKHMIGQVNLRESQAFVNALLKETTAERVRSRVLQAYGDLVKNEILAEGPDKSKTLPRKAKCRGKSA